VSHGNEEEVSGLVYRDWITVTESTKAEAHYRMSSKVRHATDITYWEPKPTCTVHTVCIIVILLWKTDAGLATGGSGISSKLIHHLWWSSYLRRLSSLPPPNIVSILGRIPEEGTKGLYPPSPSVVDYVPILVVESQTFLR
jgi:hypothetical protein